MAVNWSHGTHTNVRDVLLVMRLALAIAEHEGRETKEQDFRLAVRLLSRRDAPLCVRSETLAEAMGRSYFRL
jgi:hypothetical protein